MKTNDMYMERQRGVGLVEAMISTLLLAILFLGLAFVLSRAFVSQRYVNTQNLALLEIRNNLQTSGSGLFDICGGASPGAITVAATTIAVSNEGCAEQSITVAVGAFNYSLPLRSIALSADSELLGGELQFSSSDWPQ
ncbi:MAG: hypothetical protein WC997_10010 [Porticoccaceae bacterium]